MANQILKHVCKQVQPDQKIPARFWSMSGIWALVPLKFKICQDRQYTKALIMSAIENANTHRNMVYGLHPYCMYNKLWAHIQTPVHVQARMLWSNKKGIPIKAPQYKHRHSACETLEYTAENQSSCTCDTYPEQEKLQTGGPCCDRESAQLW